MRNTPLSSPHCQTRTFGKARAAQAIVRSFLIAGIIAGLVLLSTGPYAAASGAAFAPDQPQPVNYARITFQHVLNDLPASFGSGFLQDRDGFFWFGLQAGLAKWDGRRMELFSPSNSAISSLAITGLWEDRDGLIWIATMGGGLNRYDKATHTFTTYRHDPANPQSLSSNSIGGVYLSQSLAEDQDGQIWIGTGGSGVNRLDKTTGRITRYQHDANNPGSLSDDKVTAVYVDRAGTVWVGTRTGLNRFDPATDGFVHYQHDPANAQSLGAGAIYAMLEDRDGVFWIGTDKGGLNQLDRQTGAVTHYLPIKDDPNSLAANSIYAIAEDQSGQIWLAYNNNQVSIFDRQRGSFIHHSSDENKPDRLRGHQIDALYVDRTGVVWIIGHEGKLNKYDANAFKVTLFRHDPDNPRSIPSTSVQRAYQDRQGAMWFDAPNAGFFRYDPATDDFTRIDLPGRARRAMLDDSGGTFWVGGSTADNQGSALFVLDRTTLQYTAEYALPRGTFAADILEDPQNPDLLWFTTIDQGLGRFNRRTETFTFYSHDPKNPQSISNNSIWELAVDRDDPAIFWLSSDGGGLNRFDTRTEIFTRYTHNPDDPTSISSNVVFSFIQTSAGEFWVMGKGGGLCKFDKASGTFERYSERDGRFPNDTAVNILEDRQGYLWLNAPGGNLIRFDPRDGSSKIYQRGDGVQGGAAWAGGNASGPDGRLWFGGGEGLNAFYPDRIQDSALQPPVYLTALSQGGDLLNLGQAPERVQALQLDWQTNFFEFEVAALDYTHPEQNQYQYFLEGWDTEWYNSGSRNYGRYSGLPGGEYTLHVRGSNNDGIWSPHEAVLRITVIPPFWQTLWFQGGLAVLALGIVVGGFAWRTASIRAQNKKLEMLVAQRTEELAAAKQDADKAREVAEAANHAKTTFLANMSHELRTPLNAIINFTKFLSKERYGSLTERQAELQQRVLFNADHLLGLINDILDLAKIESGRMELQRESVDLLPLLHGVMATAIGLTKDKGLTLELDAPDQLPLVLIDKTRVRQVLLNLLSNAAKFTKQGGITVRATVADAMLQVAVQDTGIGIAPEHLEQVFEEFRQVQNDLQREYQGTGLGLPISRRLIEMHGGRLWAESTPGAGSTFSFTVPLAAPAPVPLVDLPAAVGEVSGAPVVVVDDDPQAQEILRECLASLGCQVHPVLDSQLALATIRRVRPRLVILDIMMAHPDGWELLLQLRHDPELAAIPVIISSVVDEPGRGLALGANDYLVKPIDEARLQDTVRRWLSRPATVLVIDDNADARAIVRKALEGEHQVIEAPNGLQGLALTQMVQPDLVVLDLMMPEMDGFAVLERLRANPATAHLPVVVVTARDLEPHERAWLSERAQALGIKGQFDTDQFATMVDHYLGRNN